LLISSSKKFPKFFAACALIALNLAPAGQKNLATITCPGPVSRL